MLVTISSRSLSNTLSGHQILPTSSRFLFSFISFLMVAPLSSINTVTCNLILSDLTLFQLPLKFAYTKNLFSSTLAVKLSLFWILCDHCPLGLARDNQQQRVDPLCSTGKNNLKNKHKLRLSGILPPVLKYRQTQKLTKKGSISKY